jgi:tetratricopeptide (TPR) repeat protein
VAEPESKRPRQHGDAVPSDDGESGGAAPSDDGESGDAAPSGAGVQRGRLTDLLARLAGAPELPVPESRCVALRIGSTVGRFQIVAELGRGGFGAVYDALDPELDRHVALKVLHRGGSSEDRPREGGLQGEAKTVAQLAHDNIVKVFETDLSADPAYMIMELLRGETLEDRLRRGPRSLDEALQVAVEVARALEYAHGRGVIHRDLKPSNVFLTEDGHVKVLDFGLARALGRPAPQRGGTPGYMAPEQWREGVQDARADVFAAAVMLFESLCGRLPYRIVAGRSEVLDSGPAPSLRPGVPRLLDRLLGRALSKDPAGRPAGGLAWREELLAVQREVAARERRSGTRRRVLLGGALLLVAGAFGAWTLAREWREAREREAMFYFDKARDSFAEDSLPSLRAEAVAHAAKHATDLRPRERELLHAWQERVRGDDEAALAVYERLLHAAPSDREAAYLGGDLLFHLGRFEAALPWLEVAASGETPGDWALDHLAVALHELGRRDDLDRLGRRLAAAPPGTGALHALSIVWGSIGEQPSSLSAARRELQSGGGVAALDDMVASLFQAGDLAQAEALLRERLGLEGPGVLDAREALAVVLGAQGRRREGLAVWDATATGWNGDQAWHRVLRAAYRAGDGVAEAVWRDVSEAGWPDWATPDIALLLAYVGDAEHLAVAEQRLDPLERQACRAILQHRGGRSAEAALALEAIVASPGWRHGDLAFVRAEIALGAGQPREAVELLARDRARYRRLPIGMLQSWTLPRGLYLQALAHERLGERREARAAIRRLLASWRGADDGLKLLAEARALQGRLERAP